MLAAENSGIDFGPINAHETREVVEILDDDHINLQAPGGAFFRWDSSSREHVNVTYSYVDSTHFWISTESSCGLRYGST